MKKQPTENSFHRVPTWLVLVCKQVWPILRWLWTAIIASILVSLVSYLLVKPSSDIYYSTTLIALLLSRPLIVLVFFLLFASLTLFSGLIARLAAPLSDHELKRQYLKEIIEEKEFMTLRGIPSSLNTRNVYLADIFISPQFRPNRPLVDSPISEQELHRYRQSLRQGNNYSTELEHVVFESEKNWQKLWRWSDRVGIADVWKRLNIDHVVVIQGFPGVGKSTLMERLTLHMAIRGLKLTDPTMPEQEKLVPKLLPILLHLGSYATERAKKVTLSIDDYIEQIMDARGLPGLSTYIDKVLQRNSCLVMLDGLDEVSDQMMRREVQLQIRIFITRHPSGRFLITSRVAGYDQAAFPAYPHFTLAEVDEEQISDFISRWYRANFARDRGVSTATMVQDRSIEREIEQRAVSLREVIRENSGVKSLAENPLLLALLVLMQQNSIVLPRNRVELYDVVTLTLLENRNIAKNLMPVSEFQAIQYLGPLAFRMQETNNSFMRRNEVEEYLREVIRQTGRTEEEVGAQAQDFLQRVRERGGIFTVRVGDYFGFIHRVFQEYFAARFILNRIKIAPDQWIAKLVELASHRDGLWREPFLLAVAYQSREDERIASDILSALLNKYTQDMDGREIYMLILMAEAILEAKELTIDDGLQVYTVEQLLIAYDQAQREQELSTCESIETMMRCWLASLPEAIYHNPPVLRVLTQMTGNDDDLFAQRSMLTLLSHIIPSLGNCSDIVFKSIISLLLALTGLPGIEPYLPSPGYSVSPDQGNFDLALTALSFLGKRGPAGLYLLTVRRYFSECPEQLRLLAMCSLECCISLLPVAVPEAEKQLFDTFLHSSLEIPTEHDIDRCCSIYQKWLAGAEEVIYPMAIHILAMLEKMKIHLDQLWASVWQEYLIELLQGSSYFLYWETAVLWIVLFPGDVQMLVDTIRRQFERGTPVAQLHARRFIASLCRNIESPENSSDIVLIWEVLQSDYQLLSNNPREASFPSLLNKYRKKLLDVLLSSAITQITLKKLSSEEDTASILDSLTILLGRLAQFQSQRFSPLSYGVRSHLSGSARYKRIEQEIRHILTVSVLTDSAPVTHLLQQIREQGRLCLLKFSLMERDIQELRKALQDPLSQRYRLMAERLVRCLDIRDSVRVDMPLWEEGNLWEGTLPKTELRLKTQRAFFLLRYEEENISHTEDLMERIRDGSLLFLFNIRDLPRARVQGSAIAQVIYCTPNDLMQILNSLSQSMTPSLLLSRLLLTHLESVTSKESLLPYQRVGAVSGGLFFGREDELVYLTHQSQPGGVIVGSHQSGKSSLLYRLYASFHRSAWLSTQPWTLSEKITLQTFFEQTLKRLGMLPANLAELTVDSWASTIRDYAQEKQVPIFFLDEVDGLIATDELSNFELGSQMRALHNDKRCVFYLAGHARLRAATQQDFNPFRNFLRPVLLKGLTETASKDLLQMPMKGIGFSLSDEQAERVVRGTAGVPYLLQEFCIRLLSGLSFRHAYRPDIEDSSIEEVERSQEYLKIVHKHYCYDQGLEAQCVMVMVATATEASLQDILKLSEECSLSLDRLRLNDILLRLVEFAVFTSIQQTDSEQVTYQILPQYLRQAILAMDPYQLLTENLKEMSRVEREHA